MKKRRKYNTGKTDDSPSMTLLSWKTKKRLNKLTQNRETYDQEINRLLDELETLKEKQLQSSIP